LSDVSYRNIPKVGTTVDIAETTEESTDAFFEKPQSMANIFKGDENWYYDQMMISVKVQKSKFYPDDCYLEAMSGVRYDRGWWGNHNSVHDSTRDAHLPHGAHVKEKWDTVHPLLKALITLESYNKALQYQEEFENAWNLYKSQQPTQVS